MRKGFCLVIGILFGFAAGVYADIERWSPLGPIYGGVVRAMVSNGLHVYAGTRGRRCFPAGNSLCGLETDRFAELNC